MSTPKQIAASRANGARSKGPVTTQVKRNSSRNSTRHGLYAQTIVLQAESRKKNSSCCSTNSLTNTSPPRRPKPSWWKLSPLPAGARTVSGECRKSPSITTYLPHQPPQLYLHCGPFSPCIAPRKESALTNSCCATISPSTAKFPEPSCAFNNCKTETSAQKAPPRAPTRIRLLRSQPQSQNRSHRLPPESASAERTQQPAQKKRPVRTGTQSEPVRLVPRPRAKAIHFAGYFLRKFIDCIGNSTRSLFESVDKPATRLVCNLHTISRDRCV